MQRATAIATLVAATTPALLMAKPDTANTPPMGWRSWNAFELDISQTTLTGVIDALAAPRPIWDGRNASLTSLGYTRVGIDEGWEKCGAGVNGSWHCDAWRAVLPRADGLGADAAALSVAARPGAAGQEGEEGRAAAEEAEEAEGCW